jgi:phytol kinase
MPFQNILALAASFGMALVWLRMCDAFAHHGWVSSSLSRKLIHIGTGPLFVLTWLLFADTPSARYWAALVPLAITVQFALVGLGLWHDPAAVKAMSRSGDRREILRGPLLYGIVFVALTVLFWKDSPVGIIALMVLCGGDGLADVVGKRVATRPLPWSLRKTWAGSIAMFAGGFIFSLALYTVFYAVGIFDAPALFVLPALFVIAISAAAVESLPFSDLDNITAPAAAVLLGLLLLS